MTNNDFALEERLTAWHVAVALAALFLGSWFGPLQVLEHLGIDLYPSLAPGIQSYYQGLTLHGVLNALVYTTFFITGFLTFCTVHSLKRKLSFPRLNISGFVLMAAGLVMAAIGGIIVWAALMLHFVILLGTVFVSRKVAGPVEMPVAQAVRDPQETPAWLDSWRPWLVASILLILLSYGPPLIHLVGGAELSSPGLRLW